MPRTRKLLLTTAVVGATSAVAGLGVFAAFTATTDNKNNSIASGTVAISDSDAGVSLYVLPNQSPNSTTQKCIKVTYTGSLNSTVKLYRSNTVTNGAAFTLQIERGSGLTGTGGACTGFTAAGVVYNGTLGAFPTTYGTAPDARGATWDQGDVVDYRFTVTTVDDPTPNTHTTSVASGQHDFTWEARSN